jgi:hypothetical protein
MPPSDSFPADRIMARDLRWRTLWTATAELCGNHVSRSRDIKSYRTKNVPCFLRELVMFACVRATERQRQRQRERSAGLKAGTADGYFCL